MTTCRRMIPGRTVGPAESPAHTEEPRRIFVGAGDPARPMGKCVSLDSAVEVKVDAAAA